MFKALSLCFVCISLFYISLDTGEASAQDQSFNFFRGRVISVEDEEPEAGLGAVEQTAQVRLTGGPFRGEIVQIKNTYQPDDPTAAIYLREGMEIIVAGQEEDGELAQAFLQDVARDRGLYLMLAFFAALLLLVGRKKGLRTIATLLVTLFVVVAIILPLILRGLNPVLISTVAAFGIIIITLPIIGGLNTKSISAIVGTSIGVTAAGIIAYLVGELSFLTGFTGEEAQILFFMEQPIDIRGLLFAGIIIGSLGAVTDVGMSVASAAAELSEANQNLKPSELTGAALNVGRDIMGTMSATLVLAYVGGALPLLLILMGQQISFLSIINTDLIATEIVRGFAGSIGLIISIPITAAVAGALMGKVE